MGSVIAKSDGTTLKEHIQDCILVFKELRNSVPLMEKVSGLNNFWKILFIIIYFHDFGKSHYEFQKKLAGKKNFWEFQRHEIYSIPFIDKLTLTDDYKNIIKKQILAHHKDFEKLLTYYITPEDILFELDIIWKGKKSYNKKFHPKDYVENLRNNMNYQYLSNLIIYFSKIYFAYFGGNHSIITKKKIKISEQKNPIKTIVKKQLKNILKPNSNVYWTEMILWGATKICDHYASAGIKKIYTFKVSDFNFLKRLKDDLTVIGKDFYDHQRESFSINGNTILIAPTGSGKTEAALGWLKTQLEAGQGRAFYVLPYVASINAMFGRLQRDFNDTSIEKRKLIGLQHGKLMHFLTSFNEFGSKQKNTTDYKKIRDQYKSIVCPLKIITPFQLLKYCYGVKGFEIGLSQLAGACIIFDEIHAYDEITFAQIIVSLKYFITYLRCTVFIMTATLPTFLLNELINVIKPEKVIKCNKNFLKEFNRHYVYILEGEIQDHISLIMKYKKEKKRIIIVCNTVNKAQVVYQKLIDKMKIKEEKIVLLHSRFNSVDRFIKEKKALDEKTEILIGTQAIEVSLDIDYDVVFSEPAPLDALLQRFGRINRKREKGICPVYVFTEGSENDFYIYPRQIVIRTLDLLSTIKQLEENETGSYLDYVYPSWEEDQRKVFEDTKLGFEQALYTLQPFTRYKENEKDFYDKFDGINVLPACLYTQYKKLIENANFIDADKLFVSVQRRTYMYLKKENKIEQKILSINEDEDNINTIYILIAKCKYSPEIGMTYEYQELVDVHDNIL